ncbi:SwmB domain-containing protein, partial [Verminephrobacter aporrectodeae]
MTITSVSIQADKYKLGKGESTTVHFRFNEEPLQSSFVLADDCTSMPSGTRWTSRLTRDPIDGSHYWATLSANDDTESAGGRISMDLANLLDRAGRGGSGTSQSDWFSVDTVNPRVTSITLDDTSLAAGETARVQFVFNEKVTGASVKAAFDLSNAHGTLSDPSSTDDGITWTATFTPTANTANAEACKIGLNVSQVRDLHGNAGQDSSGGSNPVYSDNYSVNTLQDSSGGSNSVYSDSYTVGTERPSLAARDITFSGDKLTLNERTITVTFTFSEPVKGLGSGNLQFTSPHWQSRGGPGTLSAPRPTDPDANGHSTVWTATLTAPPSGARSVSHKISVDLAGVTDRDGLQATTRIVESSNSYKVDTERPTATITMATMLGLNARETTVTFTFSEPVNSFTTDDIAVHSDSPVQGVLSDLRPVHGDQSSDGRTYVSGQIWTAKLTPNNDSNNNGRPQGGNRIVLRKHSVIDTFGNSGPEEDQYGPTYTVDYVGPRLLASSITFAPGETDTILSPGETATLTFVFNEAVTGFNASCIIPYTEADATRTDVEDAKGGTVSNVVSTDGGTTWTATLTAPTANTVTLNNVKIALLQAPVIDVAGNPGGGPGTRNLASTITYNVDTTRTSGTRPTAAITLVDDALSRGETTTVIIAFSERVHDFDATDIDLTNANGTLGTLRTNDNITWVATFTPTAGVEDATNTISVNLAGVTNNAHRTGAGNATSLNYTVNTRTSAPDTTSPLIFYAAVNGNQLVLTYLESNTLDETALTGNAGFRVNSSAGIATTVTSAVVNGAAKTITLTLNRAVTSTETLNVHYAKPATGAVVQDAAGNDSPDFSDWAVANNTPAGAEDTTPPVINTARLAGIGNLLVLAYTEANTLDATLIDSNLFTVTAGTSPVRIFTVVVTPTDNTVTLVLSRPVATETVTVSYTKPASGGVRDAAGNQAASFSPKAVAHSSDPDTTPPHLAPSSIRFSDSTLSIDKSTTTVTFLFSEPVKGLGSGNLQVPAGKGTLSAPRPSNPDANGHSNTWTATLTAPPGTHSSKDHKVSVDLTGVTDRDGLQANGTRTVESSNTYAIDTQQPTATITMDKTTLRENSRDAIVTIRFSEKVREFTHDDVEVHSSSPVRGTLSAWSTNDDGQTWTATLSQNNYVNDTNGRPKGGNKIILLRGHLTDLAGNWGPAEDQYGPTYTVDYFGPTLTASSITFVPGKTGTTLSAGETATLTFVFSEAVTGFDASCIIPYTTANETQRTDANTDGGTVSNVVSTDGGTTWTATLTAPTNNTVTLNNVNIAILQAPVIDLAGNPGGGPGTRNLASTITYNVNTTSAFGTRPTATITLADSALTTGETTTVTIAFSERVHGFDATDVDLMNANGTLGTLSTTNNVTWTATFTPTAGVEDATNTIRVNLAGVTNNAQRTGAGTASSSNYTVNTRPTDTTAPVINTAVVTGDQLVLTYTEAGTLDAAALTGNAGFTVNTAAGTAAITVSSAVVNATAKTVTLTLSRTVAETETVTVSYTKPESGNGVRDAAGNHAANFSAKPVVADTTPPVISTAVVTGDQLVLTYTEANSLDAAALTGNAGFTINTASGTAAPITVSSAVVNGAAKTVTLTLSRTVAETETVTVSYTKPESGNGVRDAAGNQAANFNGVIPTHDTPAPTDTTPPVLITRPRPNVNGDQLVLSFSDTGILDGDPIHKPASGAFTVLVNGVANAVTTVTVQARAKTVTLTLSTAVTHGQTVTVAYTDPTTGNDTNAIQDIAGNDVASFPATAVTNITPAPTADTTPPVFSSAAVTGDQLVLSFSDTSILDGDPIHKPASGAFTVLVNGVANAVTTVTVQSRAKTVTLTLSTAVTHGQTVTVAYTDPTTGNDTNAIQDIAGNDAASFAATAVTNNTPAPTADTTPPVFSSAAVTGDQLVLSFSDTGNLDGDPVHKPANGAFTVLVNGVANAVTTVTVQAQAKTVTLTLSTAVTHGQSVTVAYADPTTGNDTNAIQDIAGNDAASFAATAVTNNTPAPTADTTPPVFNSAAVTGDQLVLSFSDTGILDGDPIHKPASGAFTVLVNGVANAVTTVTVQARVKTVTLTLSTAVTHGQTVTVAYTDPTTGNDTNAIQDIAGNDAASFAATAVTNNTPAPTADTTPPVFSSAAVTGDQLVLSFSDTSNLEADPVHKPANGAFTVLVNGVANAVTNVTVQPQAKTVTLTLSTAVTHGQSVTVAYADPTTGNDTNAIQDTAGNDAASFAATAVTNNTPAPTADTTAPEFHSAVVTGNQLVLTYTEANNLDAAALEQNAGFTVNTAAGTAAIRVCSAVVNATAKTVTLTLDRVVARAETVSVSYTKPESGAVVQDAAGNDAANFSERAVTNNTPAGADTTPPVFSSATVNGDKLVISYTEQNSLADVTMSGGGGFTVYREYYGNGGLVRVAGEFTVQSVVVNGAAKTVTLALTERPVYHGARVTVSYSRLASGNVVQDVAGNHAANFDITTVTNITPAPGDTTPPVFSSAAVTGDQLVISYTDANSLDVVALAGNAGFAVNTAAGTAAITVSSAVVDATAKTVTLTLSRIVASTETVSVSYTKPATGAVVQDAAGNDAANFSDQAVTNNTPADTTPPEFHSAAVNGSKLVLTYTEAGTLDGAALAGNAGFTVNNAAGTATITVSSAVVNATAKTVTLTLSRIVASTETVTVNYTKPASGAVVQDAAGNDATNFSDRAVTNNTPAADTTPPVFSSATANGDKVVISYTEQNNLADVTLSGTGGFSVYRHGPPAERFHIKSVVVNGAANTVTLTLEHVPVSYGEGVSVSYAKPESGNGVQDVAGNHAASLPITRVTNITPAPGDTTPPVFSSAAVTRNQLVISYTDANSLDAVTLAGNAGYAVNTAAGTAAITVSSAVVDATAKTVTLTLSRIVASTETVSVSYTKPATGAVVQDAAGNAAANFSSQAVTNNTPADTTPPEFHSATVTGNQLVLTYTEAGTLDAAALAGNAGFTVNTAAGATAIPVNSAVVDATAKTVTLTLSRAVVNAETVSVSYTKPATGAVVQDAAGNAAANFSDQAVTNNTPADTTPPEFHSATVTGTQLVISYTEANTLDGAALAGNAGYAVNTAAGAAAITVSSALVNATTKTVTLTLSRAVASTETVTVSYTKPESGAVVQDAAGNDAANFSSRAVTNNTPAPLELNLTITLADNALTTGETTTVTFTFNQPVNGFEASDIIMCGSGTLSAPVANAARTVWTATFTPEANVSALTNVIVVNLAGVTDDAGNAGNAGSDGDVASPNYSVDTTRPAADTVAPVFSSATVNGNQLVLTYTEANTLDAAALTGNAGFTVNTAAGATAITVTGAVVSATAKTVTLTLSRAVTATETVTVSYTKPASGAVVQDAAGNDAANFSDRAVTNNTSTTPAPAD